MKITKDDKELLLSWGFLEEDLDQIEEATRVTTYEMNNEKISLSKAIEVLGREKFLSGIGRSAFHWSACRENFEGQKVYFNSAKLFR